MSNGPFLQESLSDPNVPKLSLTKEVRQQYQFAEEPTFGMASALDYHLVVIVPILFPLCSVNQMFPSGPSVIPVGAELLVGTLYSVNLPFTAMTPILFAFSSSNQRVPLGPAVISFGKLLLLGTGYSVIFPVLGLILPILCALYSANQRPPGPAIIPSGPLL